MSATSTRSSLTSNQSSPSHKQPASSQVSSKTSSLTLTWLSLVDPRDSSSVRQHYVDKRLLVTPCYTRELFQFHNPATLVLPLHQRSEFLDELRLPVYLNLSDTRLSRKDSMLHQTLTLGVVLRYSIYPFFGFDKLILDCLLPD